MNVKPVHESTLAKLKAEEQIEQEHSRRKLWRRLKAAAGWVALAGLIGAAWHDILDGMARAIGRR